MSGGEQQLKQRRPGQSVLRRAVLEGWPQVVAAAEARGGLPKRVHEEVKRYIGCGDVRRGFAVAKCDACEESVLVAFSCKTRSFCPSCAARRGHEAAVHLMNVLPSAAYRQWTLSLPSALRWPVVKDTKLLRAVEKKLVHAIARWQRQRAKLLGVKGAVETGAVSFVQVFNSLLLLQPHVHLLVPEGIWSGGELIGLPPPSTEEVASVLKRMLERVGPMLEAYQPVWPEDGFEALQFQGAQLRFKLDDGDERDRHHTRVAVGAGFSLHADTWVSANDREGLARLARYGARGPVAESRLMRRDDGKYAYETKRGVTLVLTAEQLVRRLIWLIVPKGLHLTNFHGVFSSHSKEREAVMPKSPEQVEKASAGVAQGDEKKEKKRQRIDWAMLHARTWGVDVWKCRCGGRRRVTTVVTGRRDAEEILQRMGLLERAEPLPVAQAPPQLQLAV